MGMETQHTGDHSQVAGWTQHPPLEAKGIPWTSWGLVLCFPWPQSAATPLGTSNLPGRHSRESEPCVRSQSNDIGLVKLGPCQDVPEVSAGIPWHTCTPCHATQPPRSGTSSPAPLLGSSVPEGTVTTFVLMLPDAAALIPPQCSPV